MPVPTPDALSDADQALRLDHQLCFALYSASLAMTKAYKPLLEHLNLTYPQYLEMLILWQQDGITLREIADRMLMAAGVDPMTEVTRDNLGVAESAGAIKDGKVTAD